jgi:uncharacterized phage protein gp47/JayE
VTYEEILKRMLSKIPSAIDKREGSMIYNALAPAAVELAQMYIELDVILNETFADTASRENLIKRAAERGIIPEPATYVIVKGVFNIDVPIESRYSLDDLNYVVTEKLSTGVFKLQCETIGTKANSYLGTLIPIDYIEGLTSAEVTEILVPGEDEEETEHLRERYFKNLDSQAFGGNITDYKEKTNAIPGIGGVKVYPVWAGGGTVKLVIINSEFQKPSTELVDQVQTLIDPVTNQGEGLGFAPIGHIVTVEGVNATTINISTVITYRESWTWEDIKPYVENTIDEYFLELAKIWEDEKNLIVRISQIETRVLNITGVVDITNTTINGLARNLILGENDIPVRGVVVG